jgi:hypothetical protein
VRDPPAMQKSPILVLASLVFGVSAVAGCATHYTWEASVPMPGPIGALCLEAALDADERVVDVERTSSDRFEFVLLLPDVKRKDQPSFSLGITQDAGEPVTLALSTSYEKGLFARDPDIQISRARGLVADVTEACTGKRPKLGDSYPCGRGESHNLCVDGSL